MKKIKQKAGLVNVCKVDSLEESEMTLSQATTLASICSSYQKDDMSNVLSHQKLILVLNCFIYSFQIFNLIAITL